MLVATTGPITSPDRASASIPVQLNFHHTLCQVVVQAVNLDPALDVEINGIGFKHIQNVGTLTTTTANTPDAPFSWTLPETDDRSKPTYKILLDQTIELHGATDATPLPLQDAAGGDRCVMLMLPQTLVAFNPTTRPHGASLMLHINAWNVADDTGQHDPVNPGDKKIWGLSYDQGEWMMIPLSDTWLPGQRYIYTITFGGENTTGGFEEDEDNPNKDRVFSPIGFRCDIQPWLPGGDIVQNIY